MKMLIVAALFAPLAAIAQTYPSPTFNSITLQNPLTPANGGTGATTSTGTGSVVLSNSPSLASPTITGSLTATGLVTLPSLAAQAANTVIANATGSSASPTAFTMPNCSASNTALQWASGSGFACNTGIVPSSGGNYTGALGISASNAHFNINDTSGTGSAYIVYLNNSSTAWRLLSNSSTGNFSLDRYVSGSFADSPIQVAGATGAMTLPDAVTVNGTLAANNSLSVGATRTSSTGIEIGGTAGTASSAYSDFHSSGNNIDYDSRIIASGGSATVGQGSLQYIAGGGHTFSGGVTFNSGVTMGSTLAVGGAISGAGFSNYLASPPAIGGTAANTGAFTTLTASTPAAGTNSTRVATTAFVAGHSPCPSILDNGGDNTGTNDNTTAFATTAALGPSGQACVYFPPGTYAFSGAVTYTMPTNSASITIKGAGQDVSKLVWAAGGGMKINFITDANSVHIRDLTFATGTTNTGNAIYLNQTAANTSYSTNTIPSDISYVTVRGNDGYQQTDYWANAVNVFGISNVNFISDTFIGASAEHGVGILLAGDVNRVPVQFNIIGGIFSGLQYGLYYGAYTQGVSVTASNFTNDGEGIHATGAGLDQLTVIASQFNAASVGINLTSALLQTMIYGNLFLLQTSSNGIYLNPSSSTVISSNTFAPNPGATSTTGITFNSYDALSSIVTGNQFSQITTGINLASGSKQVTATANAYNSVTSPVVDAGTGNQAYYVLGTTGYEWTGVGELHQWGTAVVTTDASGNFTIALPKTFPTAVHRCMVTNGDSSINTNAVAATQSTTTTSTIAGKMANISSATGIRVNWDCVGN
ncbi:beta strand repeat-containing protein [Burkholderia multivorans]|uniref:beta strand repeat-containing protein n=1 Tax=Burkholderia multivorans TaxID=87883 RepID=UPI0021BEA414|nr:hypothetical protein [Burkholderia multivorans]